MVKSKGQYKKKIIYFTDSHDWGGAEKYLMDLVSTIDQDTYSPVVVLPKGGEAKEFGKDLEKKGIPVDNIDTSNERPLLSFLRSFFYFIKKRPDLIHFNLPWPPLCRYPILASLLLKKKFVLTEHLVPNNYNLKPYERFFKRLIYFRIFRAIAVSFENKSNLVRIFQIPEKKIAVIHNGIDIARFQTSFSPEEGNENLHLNEEKVVLTTVARLDAQKGHYFLIEAAKLLAHLPDLCFLIVGTGRLKEKLVEDVRKAGIERQFLFLDFRKDIPYILSKTDIFVLPSLFEGLPISVLEAMAAGKPVIASDISGIPEEVIDGKTAILVPPGDPEVLAKAIEELANNPEKRHKMGEEGRKRVKEHFTLSKMVYETEKVYQMAFKTFKGRE